MTNLLDSSTIDSNDGPPSTEVRSGRRRSPVPTGGMIASRFKELRKRRGLMIALIAVTIGIPALFLGIRLILHAVAPKTYGPAGGYDIYTALVSGVLYIFGFIVAATLGATAGSADLGEGMFRHLVVTGRSRLAIYLARIPAGLGIIVPLVAVGFTLVCAVCVFAAPGQLNYDGVNVPTNLSRSGLESWAASHADQVVCNFNFNGGPSTTNPTEIPSVFKAACGTPTGTGPGSHHDGRTVFKGPTTRTLPAATPAEVRAVASQIAGQDYTDYTHFFRVPSNSLMIKSGLWLELEAVIGFMVGLGLASLIGQRTVAVVFMIILEVLLTPIDSHVRIADMSNLQRAVVGLATDHLAPGGLPVFGGGGGGPGGGSGNARLLPESTTVAVCVIVAWIVGWTVLGAWRMVKRDA